MLEISPIYVSLQVENPRGSQVCLSEWIDSATDHLAETKKKGRGRGLLIASRKADVLTQIGKSSIKAVIYRDAVEIKRIDLKTATLILVSRGHSNPSLGRRVTDYIHRLDARKVILCLDIHELEIGDTAELLDATGKGLYGSLKFERKAERRIEEIRKERKIVEEIRKERRPGGGGLSPSSKTVTDAISSLEHFAEIRGEESKKIVRLVLRDEDLCDLAPKDIVSRSVAQAYDELRIT